MYVGERDDFIELIPYTEKINECLLLDVWDKFVGEYEITSCESSSVVKAKKSKLP